MQYDRLKPGDKFHDWTVIRNAHPDHKVNKGYLCRCVCGTEKVVSARLMRSGGSKSCGCRRKGWYERKYGKSAERKI
ncbi:hypothetical protein KUW19_00750 [Ferrimonas balearica]|uniref:hypothetical protein n=1 Tax=Ferrimonas balearica TaxID=44012 RepID=UPI001C974B51|nr:hypothetical protein [Ferrimonas balearica]MBY6105005.1 hypothetical protein [Ferrimonas balearica]